MSFPLPQPWMEKQHCDYNLDLLSTTCSSMSIAHFLPSIMTGVLSYSPSPPSWPSHLSQGRQPLTLMTVSISFALEIAIPSIIGATPFSTPLLPPLLSLSETSPHSTDHKNDFNVPSSVHNGGTHPMWPPFPLPSLSPCLSPPRLPIISPRSAAASS